MSQKDPLKFCSLPLKKIQFFDKLARLIKCEYVKC